MTLPKRLRQAKAEYYRNQLQTQHKDCPKETRTSGPHRGLYCACHNKWLMWIPKEQA
jgi:hypothetical protein